mmetsp:Transcript_49806/g.115639  ORF Transcript_49806/g.115639 Transcript_49806/m.115639 type:complete len:516 (-) Transcript_49806:196-1743(-)
MSGASSGSISRPDDGLPKLEDFFRTRLWGAPVPRVPAVLNAPAMPTPAQAESMAADLPTHRDLQTRSEPTSSIPITPTPLQPPRIFEPPAPVLSPAPATPPATLARVAPASMQTSLAKPSDLADASRGLAQEGSPAHSGSFVTVPAVDSVNAGGAQEDPPRCESSQAEPARAVARTTEAMPRGPDVEMTPVRGRLKPGVSEATPPRLLKPSSGAGRWPLNLVAEELLKEAEQTEVAPVIAKKPAASATILKRQAAFLEDESSPPSRRKMSPPPASCVPVEPLRPPRGSRKQELRTLALAEVPLDSLVASKLETAGAATQRPQRLRFPPLETWRNERLVYERPRGSEVPCVVGVQLNLAPRALTDPPRHFACTSLEAPSFPTLDAVEESVGLSTAELSTRLFTMPPAQARRPAPTVRLPPACGQLHVLDGAVRCAYEGDDVAAEMRLLAGDTVLLRDWRRAVLVASLDHGRASQNCVSRFLWVQVKVSEPSIKVKDCPELKAELASPLFKAKLLEL